MIVFSALIFAILAGLLNGSFAAPVKYIDNTDEKQVWFYFSFWAFIIVPLTTFLIIDPKFYYLLLEVPLKATLASFTSGFVWGIGMACLSIALKRIGIAVSFVINIGIATSGGTLVPLIFFPQQVVKTLFTSLVCSAVIFLLIAVLFAGYAAKQREQQSSRTNHSTASNRAVAFGLLLSIFAGVSSAAQGVCYAYSLSYYQTLPQWNHQSFLLSLLPWFPCFFGGFTPYMLYFARSNSRSQGEKRSKLNTKSHALIVLMGILFFECMVFYSKATEILGVLGPIIAWPLFMIFIILISNFWGVKHGEWYRASRSSKRKMFISVGLLILAIAILVLATLSQ